MTSFHPCVAIAQNFTVTLPSGGFGKPSGACPSAVAVMPGAANNIAAIRRRKRRFKGFIVHEVKADQLIWSRRI